MKKAYMKKRFGADRMVLINLANEIIAEYQAEGMKLTLRQLYYQFVSRDYIENSLKSYKNLADVISNGRLGGFIDWSAIEDRTRNLEKVSTWDSPAEVLESAAACFKYDLWATQPNYVEVWVEKEALAAVVEKACEDLRIPFLACKGYTSQSEMYEAGRRISNRIRDGKEAHILHLGDHDPSGIDMTRDIDDRLSMFIGGNNADVCDFKVHRLALNMDQISAYKPPPNPAKSLDPRFDDYLEKYGDESWELDALDPKVIMKLITRASNEFIDTDAWREQLEIEAEAIERLNQIAADF